MASTQQLTRGGIQRAYEAMTANNLKLGESIVLQCLDTFELDTSDGDGRYLRIVVSDGEVSKVCVILKNHMTENLINKVIRLDAFATTTFHGANAIVITKISIIGEPGAVMGNPQPTSQDAASHKGNQSHMQQSSAKSIHTNTNQQYNPYGLYGQQQQQWQMNQFNNQLPSGHNQDIRHNNMQGQQQGQYQQQMYNNNNLYGNQPMMGQPNQGHLNSMQQSNHNQPVSSYQQPMSVPYNQYQNQNASYNGQPRNQPQTSSMQQTPDMPSINQPTFNYMGNSPVSHDQSAPRIVPIKTLSPYVGRWTIIGRVTSKGDVRTFTNQKGDGKVMNFDLLDASGGEIKCVSFNEAVDQFEPVIHHGRVFKVSKGTVQAASKKFNNTNSEHEIRLDTRSMVEPCNDDGSIPTMKFNFKSLSDLRTTDSGTIVDIIGVVQSIEETQSIVRKDGSSTTKRSATVADNSGTSVELCFWDNLVEKYGNPISDKINSQNERPIVAVKSCRTTSYKGISLNTVSSSILQIDPNIEEARQMNHLRADTAINSTRSITETSPTTGKTRDRHITISQIINDSADTDNLPMYIQCTATVMKLDVMSRDGYFTYPSCPEMASNERKCGKKVKFDDARNAYVCDRHAESLISNPEFRYMANVRLQDATGKIEASGLGDSIDNVMGMQAEEFRALEEDDSPLKDKTLEEVGWKTFLFKMKAASETYQETNRIKYTVVSSDSPDYAKETRDLLANLPAIERGEAVEASAQPSNPLPAMKPQAPQETNANTNSAMNHDRDMNNNGGKEDKCYSCNGYGHWAANCPHKGAQTNQQMKSNSNGVMGSETTCFNCNQKGHWATNCPTPKMNVNDGGSGSAMGGNHNQQMQCYICKGYGHLANNCSQRRGAAGGGFAGGSACFKCNGQGHWASNCPNA